MEPEYRHDAFISYRHVEPDRSWAIWLHRSLETYRVPKSLVRTKAVPRRLNRVFRDEEELAASSSLSEDIDQALTQSRSLIVVASPRVVESQWCEEEIRRFIALGRADRIRVLLVEGEPRESFPGPLIEGDDEPIAADVRSQPGEPMRRVKRLAKLRILAALLGCSFDDLRRREQERHTRRLIGVTVGLVVLSLTLAILSVVAIRARERAETSDRQSRARLAGAYTEQGLQRLRQEDPTGALLWFVNALSVEQGSDEHEAPHRRRISSVLTEHPVLVSCWQLAGLTADEVIDRAAASPDGRLIVTLVRPYRDGGGMLIWVPRLEVWDAREGRRLQGLDLDLHDPALGDDVPGDNPRFDLHLGPRADGGWQIVVDSPHDDDVRAFRMSQSGTEVLPDDPRVPTADAIPGEFHATSDGGTVKLWKRRPWSIADVEIPDAQSVGRMGFTADGGTLTCITGSPVAGESPGANDPHRILTGPWLREYETGSGEPARGPIRLGGEAARSVLGLSGLLLGASVETPLGVLDPASSADPPLEAYLHLVAGPGRLFRSERIGTADAPDSQPASGSRVSADGTG